MSDPAQPIEDGAPAEAGADVSEPGPGPEAVAASESEEGSEEAEELPPLVSVLEAALFASAEAVPLNRLSRVLGAWSRKQIVAGLKELAERQEREGSGIRLVETGGGFQLRSVADYAPWVRKFFAERPPRLSRAVLETLAIVGYKQPVTRGEVEAVRGVNCDAVLGSLTARGLVQVIGRRQSPGRPVEYGTTREFLELFSLRDLSELPPLPDPSSLASLIEEAQAEGEVDGEESEDAGESEPRGRSQGGDEGEPSDAHDAHEDGTIVHAEEQRAVAEDLEPSGDRVPEIGGDPDSRGESAGQREGDPRAGGEG